MRVTARADTEMRLSSVADGRKIQLIRIFGRLKPTPPSQKHAAATFARSVLSERRPLFQFSEPIRTGAARRSLPYWMRSSLKKKTARDGSSGPPPISTAAMPKPSEHRSPAPAANAMRMAAVGPIAGRDYRAERCRGYYQPPRMPSSLPMLRPIGASAGRMPIRRSRSG